MPSARSSTHPLAATARKALLESCNTRQMSPPSGRPDPPSRSGIALRSATLGVRIPRQVQSINIEVFPQRSMISSDGQGYAIHAPKALHLLGERHALVKIATEDIGIDRDESDLAYKDPPSVPRRLGTRGAAVFRNWRATHVWVPDPPPDHFPGDAGRACGSTGRWRPKSQATRMTSHAVAQSICRHPDRPDLFGRWDGDYSSYTK